VVRRGGRGAQPGDLVREIRRLICNDQDVPRPMTEAAAGISDRREKLFHLVPELATTRGTLKTDTGFQPSDLLLEVALTARAG